MSSFPIARLAACIAALLLASCATTPAATALPALDRVPAAFEMSGRLAVRRGDRSEIARLRWTHAPAADTWVFASPLGNEVARIESSAGGATLTQGGGERQAAPSFSALTERILGVALEPATLAGWLHGTSAAPAPGDWNVTLDEKQRAGSVELVRRLSAIRGDVVVRLVVDEYRVVQE
ncbi:MAG: outer membrane lipoprotein LolB [Usitatibacter sp.]